MSNRHGENKRHVREVNSICELIVNVLEDFILKVLMVAAVVATVVGIYNDGFALGWIDGVSILVAIVIIVVVTVGNDLAKEAKFQELMQRSDEMIARVFVVNLQDDILVGVPASMLDMAFVIVEEIVWAAGHD